MAPEIYLSEGFDFKVGVDLFAMVMFFVLTGLEPFSDYRNQFVRARRVANGESPRYPGRWAPGTPA
jgi:hypothetical protein